MRGYRLRGFAMRIIVATLLFLALGACVHKIDVQQGNYVTQDLVDKLGVGMTKAEVKQLLGTPLLADPFHANRWDYYFSNVVGRRSAERARLSVFFENDKVVSFTGEGRPAGSSPARSPTETPRPTPPSR
jgi:outer membrane protein assembly factor BamE